MSMCVRVCNPSLEDQALQSLLYTQDTVSNRSKKLLVVKGQHYPPCFKKTTPSDS